MTAVESCGTCSLCCKLLEIQAEADIGYDFKPYNKWCKHCKPGSLPGGCQVYQARPKACQDFQCLWLQSQLRSDVPSMASELKPSKSHCIFIESDDSPDVSFIFVDPSYPHSHKQEPVRSLLIDVTNKGRTVVIVIGQERHLMTKDRPTIRLTEGQLHEFVSQQLAAIKTDHSGKMQVGYPPPQQQMQQLLTTTRASTDPSLVPRPAAVPRLRDEYYEC